MIDFLVISTRSKKGCIEIYPKFIIKKSTDLMIRGGDFYAIFDDETKLWSTDEQDAIRLIDKELDTFYEENKNKFNSNIKLLHMWDAETGIIDAWHKYCQKQMRDNFHMLDEKIIFSNVETTKKDYASKKLKYPFEESDISSYNKIMSTLYSDEERQKIEWAIGSIISGDSKKIQKFLVLYGSAGTGKSTILNIIEQLFDGYHSVFDAKALGSSNNSFALEAFKENPLVAIQHDGDLSRIEDNTRLNSLVSHELMTVNEKFKSTYANRFKCFLFMGTNKPVKITDAKSGLIRRLIDVSPTGNKIESKEYLKLTKQVSFELGGIAKHCYDVYMNNQNAYDNYIPISMLGATNDFYNFVLDSYLIFKKENGTTLKSAWEMYKTYCDDAKVMYPLSLKAFKEELKNYFKEYEERTQLEDGTRVRSYFSNFITNKFENDIDQTRDTISNEAICFKEQKSFLDEYCKGCLAQYANESGAPKNKWEKVKTVLSDIDTSELHYVQVPENLITIDFDIPDENGNKCYEKNLEEASKWPPTYAELSKSGSGIHLHYIYNGNVEELSPIYSDHIEIKVQKGNASLRRKLTKCNDLKIATITSGLPLKGVKKMVNFDSIKSEKVLRNRIKKALAKEVHGATKPNIDYINHCLESAYEQGLKYDITDMRNAILAFGANSTNQADYCIRLVNKMKFKSDENSENVRNDTAPLVFYDCEVFPNLFLVNWKIQGKDQPVVRMINPKPADIETILKFRLVGFNCRRYDNHMLYACLMGYTNEQLYTLSQRIISGSSNCFFGEAYNLSYTDVYDFCSVKQSLKKWEIDLGIHHQELGMPWDKAVPKDMWEKVAEYCDNDVIATEAVFDARQADFTARKILADVAGMSVNDTTNSLTTRIIFGNDRKPQSKFNYRNMGDLSVPHDNFLFSEDGKIYPNSSEDNYFVFDEKGRPLFPGYKFEKGISTYRDEEVGEGGYVYSEPGMYGNVALLDIASMHPSSIVAEQLFGEYTSRFSDILNARIAIKHKDFDTAKKMLNGALAKYLTSEEAASDLAQALKIAINSVYGLTSAKFETPCRDPRNIDNIVAKRGALFMINLKHEVQKRGFIVAHIKTDSIKIPDATKEIINFVMDYGSAYGYNFEHEATYERICLINKAVYIAKYATYEHCEELYGKEYLDSHPDFLKDNKKHPNEWTATGTEFQVPYVYKTLFTKENVVFDDLCETRAVKSSLYLDMNEDLKDVYEEEKELNKLSKIKKEDLTPEIAERCLELSDIVSSGHNYIFIGKVGLFCPIKQGCGGGILVRDQNGKFNSVTGTQGYRWLESEMVKTLNKENDIDLSYYNSLADDAKSAISEYVNYDWFVSDEPYVGPKIIDGKPLYFDEPPVY